MKTFITTLLLSLSLLSFAQNEKTLQFVSITNDIDTCENLPIKLIVEFVDYDSLQWERNDGTGYVSLSDDATYSGTNNDTLLFTTSMLLDNSQFRCVGYNLGDSILSDALIINIENIYPTLINNIFQNVCFRDSVELSVVNSDITLWSTGQTQDTIYVQSDTTQYYYIDASNSFNCLLHDSVLVEINYLTLDLIVPDTICQNNEFMAIVNVSGQYSSIYWHFSSDYGWSYNDTVFFTCDETGYQPISCFLYNNLNNCRSDTIEQFIYSLNNEVEIENHYDTLITFVNVNSFQWAFNNNILFGDTNNYLVAETMGIYNLFSTNTDNGCSSKTDFFFHNNLFDTIIVNQNNICKGDTASLFNKNLNCKIINFNNSDLDILTSNTTPFFDNPCVESFDNSTYFWIGNDNCFARELTTEVLDITDSVEICFNFVMAYQGEGEPCEGPDELDEGVSLQYSIDSGISWQNITYFCPNGKEYLANVWNGESTSGFRGFKTKFNDWETYCYDIYPQEPQIKIRWIQETYTPLGDPCKVNYDQWGLDNIYICGLSDSNISIQWYQDTSFISNEDTIHVSPVQTSVYYAYFYDSFLLIDSAQVEVVVNPLPYPFIYTDTSNTISTDTYEQYQWYLNNNDILGATNNSYTIDTSAYYFVQVTDTNGCIGNSDTIFISISSVDEVGNNNIIKIYPNPANNYLFIESTDVISKIEISDINGKVFYRQENQSNKIQIDVSNLEKGIYFINIIGINHKIKFIKQ